MLFPILFYQSESEEQLIATNFCLLRRTMQGFDGIIKAQGVVAVCTTMKILCFLHPAVVLQAVEDILGLCFCGHKKGFQNLLADETPL